MDREHALVAFARGSGAWVLYASGHALNHAIDLFGREADAVGLLRSTQGRRPHMQGLFVWEGFPTRVSVDRGPWVPTFDNGTWRELDTDEWAKVQAGDIALWPLRGGSEDSEGFEEPRAQA